MNKNNTLTFSAQRQIILHFYYISEAISTYWRLNEALIFELASSLVLSYCGQKQCRKMVIVKELNSVNSPVCFIPIVQNVYHGLKTLLDADFLSKKKGETRLKTDLTIPRTKTTRSLCIKLWTSF